MEARTVEQKKPTPEAIAALEALIEANREFRDLDERETGAAQWWCALSKVLRATNAFDEASGCRRRPPTRD